MLGQAARSAWAKLSQMFVRSGEIPSPRQTWIDKTNDCVMKSERGALVSSSDRPSGQCSQHGRWYVAGAGQASDTNTFGRCCVENRRQKISIPLRWQKKKFFVGEERRRPKATSRPLDHGSTWYLRGRHLHSLALPDTKRVGRGLIPCRDRRSVVAWAVVDQRADNFNVKAQVPPRAAIFNRSYSQLTFFNFFSNINKTNLSSSFPIAAVREYLQPISFLNSLQTKLCNIAFPLASVLLIFRILFIFPVFPVFLGKTWKSGKSCLIRTVLNRSVKDRQVISLGSVSRRWGSSLG